MTSLFCYLILLFAIAVALDLYFVAGLKKFRTLRKEATDENGNLTISRRELIR